MASDGAHSGNAFDRFVRALGSTGCDPQTEDNHGTALCPSHHDSKPSLTFMDGDTGVVLTCHAGCDTETIVRSLGLNLVELFNSPGMQMGARRDPENEYVYRDENGEPVFKVVRYASKEFRQYRWNGISWDVTLGDARRVLYKLPDVIAAVAVPSWVFLVEGEKDAERLIAEGFTATTIAMGANRGNWDKTDTSALDGASVVVIGDNDAPGRRYARHVANSLSSRAAQVRLVRLPGLPDKGDVSDWFDSGNTSASLWGLVESTPALQARRRFEGAEPFATNGELSAYTADSLRQWARTRPTWRIRGLLLKDTHLVVGASKKTLKTTLVSGEMAYAIANGTPWLDDDNFVVEAPAPVVVVINEGLKSYMRSLDRIPERRGAESLGPIFVIEAGGVNIDDGDLNAVIAETVEQTGAGVIIYDAWYGFVGGDVDASNLYSMSDVFKVVQRVAGELMIDPVIVHHLKKNSTGRPDLDDLTFAGVAEWSDSWMLFTHRSAARPGEGEYRLGLVAGSRQWGEVDYEIDGSFGPTDIDAGGYTKAPTWKIARVSAEQSRNWGKTSTRPAADPEPGILKLLAEQPYMYTKSQITANAPGTEKSNRTILETLIEDGTVVSARLRRAESNGVKTRDLLALGGVDPATTDQQRLAPIGNDQPTIVRHGGAGNSPEAAVSALSEPPAEVNIGNGADVDSAYVPTGAAPTSDVANVVDQVPGEDVIPGGKASSQVKAAQTSWGS